MTTAPKIALISAVTAAIPPAESAIADEMPDAVVWNILDDRLLTDADERGGLDDGLRRRMLRLIGHALDEGANGVLLTCSLYGSVARDAPADVPILAADEAAFAEIAASAYGTVLVVASFDAARDDSVRRLEQALAETEKSIRVEGITAPAAMPATRAGDRQALISALYDACAPHATRVDAVFLAQYSLAPAAGALQDALGIPVLSGPKSSADTLRRLTERRDDA